jgi:AI2M/AI1M-like HNH endonuclease
MAARYKAKIETPHGLRTCFEARVARDGKKDLVARFGGIPLRRNKTVVIADPVPVLAPMPRKELLFRLRAARCELCGRRGTVAVVHQVAKLARLGTPGPGQPAWAALMARMRRKTLVVCQPCHQAIHATPVTHAA